MPGPVSAPARPGADGIRAVGAEPEITARERNRATETGRDCDDDKLTPANPAGGNSMAAYLVANFALTNPHAGSDAASIPDAAVVCTGMWQGQEVLGMRVSWDKRW